MEEVSTFGPRLLARTTGRDLKDLRDFASSEDTTLEKIADAWENLREMVPDSCHGCPGLVYLCSQASNDPEELDTLREAIKNANPATCTEGSTVLSFCPIDLDTKSMNFYEILKKLRNK